MKELTQDNLKEIIEAKKNVIVQYGASWCGACRMIKPQVNKLGQENENIEFYYVDAEKFPESRSIVEVNNLPTFAGFKEGALVKSSFGTNIKIVKGIIDEVTGN